MPEAPPPVPRASRRPGSSQKASLSSYEVDPDALADGDGVGVRPDLVGAAQHVEPAHHPAGAAGPVPRR